MLTKPQPVSSATSRHRRLTSSYVPSTGTTVAPYARAWSTLAGSRSAGMNTKAGSPAAAAAAAAGLPAFVFIPADLEPAKVDHALAYGATVVPVEGTYDDVNRLCLEVADETGWGFVNINLRRTTPRGPRRSPSRSPRRS